MMQNLKRNWLVSLKLTWEIWGLLTWAFKNLKNFTLMGCFSKAVAGRPQACNCIKKETLAQLFSCEFREIFKNTFLYRTPLLAASSFWPKCIMFELRTYRGVMFDGNEDWYKIWRKTDLCFKKLHKEFGKFSPEHSIVSKLGFWWDPFIQSRKSMSLKYSGELFVMTVENNAKFEVELTYQFKI